ncbi:MAG: hypothetical protein Q8P50_02360 [Bacillota bacterium]|nr:hypothetical protein [Bacillota bacterium]
MLAPGKSAELVGFLLSILIIGYAMYRAKATGKVPQVRRIAGLDAIDEAVQRATEMGRPVMMVPGTGDVTDAFAVQTLAGLAILRRTATLCARYDTKLYVSIKRANLLPIASEIVRESFANENKPDRYSEDTVQWFSDDQFAHALATVGVMTREKVASAILTGFFQAESLLLAEAAGQLGAITIGGCGRLSQIPFFVVCCDYCLIGEELMVAGAYLDRRPIMLGAIQGQDIAKSILVLLTIIGVAMMTISNNSSLVKLLKK